MRLPGRMAAAIEVLADIERRHRPVADALKAWGLDNRFAGSGDRAAIGNLVYDALRRQASHAYAMGADTPRALVLSVAVRDWGEAPEELGDLFAQDAHAPETLSVDEVHRLSMPDPLSEAPDHIRADFPLWGIAHMPFGDDLVTEGQAMAARPPLDLRVNTLKSDRARGLKALDRFGAGATELSPVGMRIVAGQRDSRTPNVQVEEGFLKGGFEVQDQGSQIAALLTGATAGEQVLDLCAGAGGKTLAMAAAMNNTGQIFAHDSDRHRLAPIYDRLKRNGARNVQVRPPNENLDDLAGKMDRVVIDAPCTGSGTWRRRPDAKWKLTAEQLQLRVAEQKSVLADGAHYVRPGGTLTYITCSILNDENERQATEFLATHPNFEPVDMSRAMYELSPALRERVWRLSHGVLLTPGRTGTDGFFVFSARRQ
jgi:16S rRNA (cytosine967-C5)-methyltransferase